MTHRHHKLTLICGLLAGLTACQPHAQNLSTSDIDAITRASETWVETYNRNDWSALASLFVDDAIMMPPNSPSVNGRAAIAAWEAQNESGFRIAFDIQEISGHGDTAYVYGRSCVFIPLGSNELEGEFGVDVGKFLEVRAQQPNGDWLIQADIFNSDAAMGSELATACPFAERP